MNMINAKRSVALLVFLPLLGCSTVGNWFGGDNMQMSKSSDITAETADDRENNVKPATNGQLELKLAKLWTRVDELEEKNRQLKAHVKVLERGLVLGILPDELKDSADLEYERDKDIPRELPL